MSTLKAKPPSINFLLENSAESLSKQKEKTTSSKLTFFFKIFKEGNNFLSFKQQ
ncbi:MAG: hypothetical protein WC812_01365 [Candidatus Pacearchaeota archaeon]